ncbi:MAG: Ig-like domain-containing protein [Gammaproteobacteria bacterium]|nr:Ig-like domain-containing protein [Gammaproteobacteria bacterium]
MRKIGPFIGIFVTAGLAAHVQAAQVVTNIEGSLGIAENTCVQPIALFAFKNCNFSGGPMVATEIGLDADAIGPLDSGGFYADTASAPPFVLSSEPGVDDAGVPLNTFLINEGSAAGDGKIAPPLSGTITIDDGGDGFGDTTDTLAGTLVIGPAARLASVSGNLAGPSAIVEEWTSITHTLPATAVSSATPNGFGGFDYVLGVVGFPDNICTGLGGNPMGVGDCFASEVGADSANATSDSPWLMNNGGTGLNWDGAAGTDITRYGLTFFGPGPNPGGATTAIIAGLICTDTGLEPKEPGNPPDTMTACQDSAIGWSIVDLVDTDAGKLNAGFDNLVMKLSTNSANEVVAADAYYTMEYPIIQPGDNSWVGSVLSFAKANPIPNAVDDPTNPADVNILTSIDVLANDTDLDDTPLTVNIESGPSFGTANVVDSGGGTPASIRVEYTYTAAAVNAADTFTYSIDDNTPDTSNTATVNVQISNKTPTAMDDNAATDPGFSTTIPVLNNDTLGDEPTAAVSLVPGSGPTLGTAVVETDLQITYTSTGAPGTDTFRYTLQDYNGDISNEAEVTVTICPANTICAVNDSVLTDVGVPVSINPLSNDAGLTNLPLIGVTILTPPTNGTIGAITGCTQVATCDVPYTPGAAGADSFVYQVEDSMGMTDSATVNVTVNDLPVANDNMATTGVGTAVNVNILADDTGLSDTPLVVAFPTLAANGTLAQAGCDAQSTCVVTYTNDGTPGPDIFTYTVTDEAGTGDISNVATVTITVDDSPVTVDDAANVEPGLSVDIPVLLNDSGLSDVPLMLTVTSPANGSVTQAGCDAQATCILTYTNSGATGVDTFDYTVTDADGDSDTAIVSVTVADPSIPIAVDDVAQTSRNQAVIIDVLANDSGLVDVPISVELITPARNGRLTVNGPQQGGTLADPTDVRVTGDPDDIDITYAPGNNFFGSDSFSYQVTDDGGQSSQATVHITVVDDQAIITLPSDDGSALSPWSLALLSVLIWLRRRRSV